MLSPEEQKEQKVLLERTQREWSKIAGEELKIEKIGGVIYAFGSELGCLRLAHKMRSFQVKYSVNLKTWYFSNER